MWLLAVSAPDMSMQDAATYLRVTTRTVRTMVLDGRLKAYQLGPRVIRFRRSEIDAALTPINVQPAAIGTPQKTRRRPGRRRYPEPEALKDLATG